MIMLVFRITYYSITMEAKKKRNKNFLKLKH
jgi:hypothetical protein